MITVEKDENLSLSPVTTASTAFALDNRNRQDSVFDRIKEYCYYTIRYTNVKYVSSNTEYIQVFVNCVFPLNNKVDLKIDYSKGLFDSKDINKCSKLKICIEDDGLKNELKSCTNYLQRQKSLFLALSTLKKCFLFTWERTSILQLLMLYCETNIDIAFKDCFIEIICSDETYNFKFFLSSWKIHFDYTNHFVTDRIDFLYTKSDLDFYSKIKNVMRSLALPCVPYNTKVDLWWSIIQAVNASVAAGVYKCNFVRNDDYLRVGSIDEDDSEELQIIESDDEVCIVLE